MAEIWVATDEVLDRQVAVKMMRPELTTEPAIVERFRREALAAARLSHPAIVAVFDTVGDAGDEAVIMELVAGRTLRDELHDHGRLPVADVVRIGMELCGALEAAHASGIVHRDLKPSNVLLATDGRILLTDFGIAKAMGTPPDLTGDDLMMGTAKYLSPEQVRGEPLDGRSDLFALGVVLYECLTGQVPFEGANDSATALARLQRDAFPPRTLRPGIPRALDDLVQRLLSREVGGRPADAAEARGALQRLQVAVADETGMIDVRDVTPVHGIGPAYRAGGPPTPSAGRRIPASLRSERRWLVPVVIIVLVAIAVGTAGVLLGRTDAGEGLLRAARGETEVTRPATAGTTTATAVATPVTIGTVGEFDPAPGDGREHPELLRNLLDADPTSVWTTENYRSRDIAGKPGVGLIVQLTGPASGMSLVISSPTSGWVAQVFVSTSSAAALAGWGKPAATVSVKQATTTVPLGAGPGRFVLLWITSLSDAAPRYQVAIANLALAASN